MWGGGGSGGGWGTSDNWMKPPLTVTLNLNNESGVCAGATSWPSHPSVEVTNHSLSFHPTDVTRLTRTDQRTAGSGGLHLRGSLKNSGLVNGGLYILMCNRQSFQQTADRLAFIGGGYFFLMVERTHNKDKWFLRLPSFPFLPPLSPSVSNSQAACFPSPSSFLSAHLLVFTPHPPLLLSVWHSRGWRCVRRAADTSVAAAEHVHRRLMGQLVNDNSAFPRSGSNT